MAMNENIITAVFGAFRETRVRPRYRWDTGQVLIIRGVKNLPDFFEVHFANEGGAADAVPVLGTPEGIHIPDSVFQSGKAVYAYIYVHNAATDGTTVYKVTIPVLNRARPSNAAPDPEDADIIAQAIAALNGAVGNIDKFPVIRDGVWFAWDTDSGEYVSTGVSATGPQGPQGERGESGEVAVDVALSESSANPVENRVIAQAVYAMQGDIGFLKSMFIDLTWAQIAQIVRSGRAAEYFKIGDERTIDWSADANTVYKLKWDVVNIANVVNQYGESVPGLWLQSHWALPNIQFDGNEAFWHCDEALAAGTYNVTMGNNWGANVVKDKIYQFTLTQDVPAGGQLVFTTATSTTAALPDQNPSNWRVRSYSSAASTSQIEMATVMEGSGGTSLGTLSSSTKYGATGLNNMQRASYGYNRWSQSGIRQWLNSDAAAGNWWSAQNVYDRPPDQLTSVRGFMAGLPEDFLNVVKPVQVVTALNTISDVDIGASETTYDRFFLPSLEQEYCVAQVEGVEGAFFPYWKERLEISSPQRIGSDHAVLAHARCGIENHAAIQYIRLRSAYRSGVSNTWYFGMTGGVFSGGIAANLSRPCPVCVIC